MANKKAKGVDQGTFKKCFNGTSKPYPGSNPQKGIGKEYKP